MGRDEISPGIVRATCDQPEGARGRAKAARGLPPEGAGLNVQQHARRRTPTDRQHRPHAFGGAGCRTLGSAPGGALSPMGSTGRMPAAGRSAAARATRQVVHSHRWAAPAARLRQGELPHLGQHATAEGITTRKAKPSGNGSGKNWRLSESVAHGHPHGLGAAARGINPHCGRRIHETHRNLPAGT